MSKVSILMNCYNGEDYLKEAIDSVYSQTFTDWEIVFIDNCSTDSSAEIAKSYGKKIKYYKTEKNIPLGAARNFGLKYCKGMYLAFLDTDDIWLKNKLDIQIKIMEKSKEYQLCYGGVIYINEHGNEIKSFLPKAKNKDNFSLQLKCYEINMQSVLLRNNININFDESMQFCPDFDLFMKISSMYRVVGIKNYLVKYRILQNSLTKQKMSIWWIEIKKTLDDIFNNNLVLKEKYIKEYRFAYAKVAYNKARYLMYIGNKKDANKELLKYAFLDFKYFVLFISSFNTYLWNLIHKIK